MLKLSDLRKLLRHLEHSGIGVLAIEEPGLQLRIAMDSRREATRFRDGVAPLEPPAATPAQGEAVGTVGPRCILRSPLIGFFVAAHPNRNDLLVAAGQVVVPGQVLGLVRSVGGVLRTVRSPWAGTIVSREIEDGALVDFGKPLFAIRMQEVEAA